MKTPPRSFQHGPQLGLDQSNVDALCYARPLLPTAILLLLIRHGAPGVIDDFAREGAELFLLPRGLLCHYHRSTRHATNTTTVSGPPD